MDYGWIEIDAGLGAALWAVYRQHMGVGSKAIGVHESASDPEGQWGQPSMLTVVGSSARGGGPLMKLESTWDVGFDPVSRIEVRRNYTTRYWLPTEPKCPDCAEDSR